MYGFVPNQTIDMGEMVFQKKPTLQKSCQHSNIRNIRDCWQLFYALIFFRKAISTISMPCKGMEPFFHHSSFNGLREKADSKLVYFFERTMYF